MEEVDATKCTCDQRENSVSDAFNLHLGPTTSVGKDITLSKLNESQLDVVAVGKEVYFVLAITQPVLRTTQPTNPQDSEDQFPSIEETRRDHSCSAGLCIGEQDRWSDRIDPAHVQRSS